MSPDPVSVFFAALFAGIVAILSTVLLERIGGALGGIVTLPTTIVPASVGIWSEVLDASSFSSAMSMVPIGMLLNLLFLGVWRVSPGFLSHFLDESFILPAITAISVSLWVVTAGSSALIVEQSSESIKPVSIALLTTIASVLLGLWAVKTNPPAPSGKNSVGIIVLLFRGLAAAVAIGASVWIASLNLPFVSGIISVFPAIFLTTMVSLWLSQGPHVPVGAAGPMMLGSASVSIYALISIVIFPIYGPWVGSILTWLISVLLYTIPAGLWTWRKLDAGGMGV
tara:strand:+ start:8918 stop:9766 length:849 start_codon:yes stop_codon:yes gene_type:complete